MNLNELGWNTTFNDHFIQYEKQNLFPARIAREEKQFYLVYSEFGELSAEVSGKLLHTAESRSDFPAVGDWVAISVLSEERQAIIHAVLPRQSSFSRKAAGFKTEEQIVAANVDTLFIVSGLDGDYNLRRIERYLTLAWNCGADPIIILNKSDLCDDVEERISQVETVAFGIPIHPISALENSSLDTLFKYFKTGKTIALIGSSGVGKSSIINSILGTERQAVKSVREDDSRGRHTTTRRELIFLPEGGMVIDSPGMRELQLWTDGESLYGTFDDIEAIAVECRFNDCQHSNEPGCAVRQAIETGTLERKRFDNYIKLQRELRYLETRQNQKVRLNTKARWKRITKQIRQIKKTKG